MSMAGWRWRLRARGRRLPSLGCEPCARMSGTGCRSPDGGPRRPGTCGSPRYCSLPGCRQCLGRYGSRGGSGSSHPRSEWNFSDPTMTLQHDKALMWCFTVCSGCFWACCSATLPEFTHFGGERFPLTPPLWLKVRRGTRRPSCASRSLSAGRRRSASRRPGASNSPASGSRGRCMRIACAGMQGSFQLADLGVSCIHVCEQGLEPRHADGLGYR